MWLRSVYAKTLRDHRTGALLWGIAPGLLISVTLTQFEQIVGPPEQRAALVALAEQFRWYEEPIGITKPGGFATFRLGPMLGILPAIWALLAASGQMRGEEERGALDLVLATPVSRARVVAEKLAALATGLVVLALTLGSIVAVAGSASGAEFTTVDAYVFGLNVALAAGVYGAIALLLSQFLSERSAVAGLTGGLLALSFALNTTARVSPNLVWLGYLSPLHYFGLTKPLVPEVGINTGGMAMLAMIVLVCGVCAAWLFTRRDLGFALRVLPARAGEEVATTSGWTFAPTGDWSLRSPFMRALRTSAVGAVWWALGAGLYAFWMTLVAKELHGNMLGLAQASPILSRIFAPLLDTAQGTAVFINMLVFSFTPLALSAYAIGQVTRWASDEEAGRTEMLLSTPASRAAAFLSHFAAIAVSLTGVALALGVAMIVAAAAADVPLGAGQLLLASLGLVPVLFCIAALGGLLAGWLGSSRVGSLLTAYVVTAFFLVFLGPAFGLPDAVIALSVFDAYGSPLVDGWQWGPMLIVLWLSALLVAGATLRFARKDLAR